MKLIGFLHLNYVWVSQVCLYPVTKCTVAKRYILQATAEVAEQ